MLAPRNKGVTLRVRYKKTRQSFEARRACGGSLLRNGVTYVGSDFYANLSFRSLYFAASSLSLNR